MTTSQLTLEVTVVTTDHNETVHKYDWPADLNAQLQLRLELGMRIQAGFSNPTNPTNPTIGLIMFDHPSVVYNPAHFVRAKMMVSGPETQQDEVEVANRRMGVLQDDEPGRG